jgi:hypothetical protein
MVKYVLAISLLIASSAGAVCNTVSTDDNTRLRTLAQDQFEQSAVEFKKGNTVRGCELLKISRSFIKQTDDKIITEHIVVQYDKLCEAKQ